MEQVQKRLSHHKICSYLASSKKTLILYCTYSSNNQKYRIRSYVRFGPNYYNELWAKTTLAYVYAQSFIEGQYDLITLEIRYAANRNFYNIILDYCRGA